MKKILLFILLFFPLILSGQDNPNILALQSMGSQLKALPLGTPWLSFGSEETLVDGRIYLIAVYLQKATTLTGVLFFQSTQGDYTADNNNKVGLYTVSGGTATLVASCADDGNLWKNAAITFVKKAFSSTYVASVGIYYIAFLYNNSAQVTAPKIGRTTDMIHQTITVCDFTNSNKFMCYVAGTDLPGSFAMNTTTNYYTNFSIGVY